jgi:large subunit ribosomal protein L29
LKTAELRELPSEELQTRLDEVKEELFNLRFQHATGQLENYSRLGQLRKDVARLRSIQRERDLGIGHEPEPEEVERGRRRREREKEEADAEPRRRRGLRRGRGEEEETAAGEATEATGSSEEVAEEAEDEQ